MHFFYAYENIFKIIFEIQLKIWKCSIHLRGEQTTDING